MSLKSLLFLIITIIIEKTANSWLTNLSDVVSTDAQDVLVGFNGRRVTVAVNVRHFNDGGLTAWRDRDDAFYWRYTAALYTLHTDKHTHSPKACNVIGKSPENIQTRWLPFSGMWHGGATRKTCSELYICQFVGFLRIWGHAKDVHVTLGYGC